MANFLHPQNEFLKRVVVIVEKNLAHEHFEVPDLAEELNMSRSNLLRKVKASSGCSVSVFIRKVRLHHAKAMLMDDSLTVSEVSYKVGFNSTSYFTKCFREEFGYTPGDIPKEEEFSELGLPPKVEMDFVKKMTFIGLFILIGMMLILVVFQQFGSEDRKISMEKSIAVLPFKNDSDDSSNTHIVNGLMEAVLDNLQRIKDLDVTSRTSVEKYRNAEKSIRELSDELEVNYFVEGSGQKIGDQILLTIQLIDGKNDRHVWSQQYEREAKDIFKLQTEIARDIALNVQAVITPEEKQRIEKIPTDNLLAYDYFLRGSDLLSKAQSNEVLWEAISLFNKAIEEDAEFANPYAYIAICYYYLEFYKADKEYDLEINKYADKALLYDTELPESHLAKALYYQQDGQYKLAVSFFEKVLFYSPNSTRVHNYLSDIYTAHIPNTEKYLKHALKGIKVATADQDSVTASNTYLHLGNALIQNGFVKEAKQYIRKAELFNPENPYTKYLSVFIRLADNFDLEIAKKELIQLWEKDTLRIDLLQEIGKVYYTMGANEESWEYYQKFIELKTKWNLNIYQAEDIKIAYVLDEIGMKEEAQLYYDTFLQFAENDETIYKDLHLSSYYAAKGDVDKGINQMKAFLNQNDFQYWLVLFLDKDPLILKLSSHPDFKSTIDQISENFWNGHQQIRKTLEKEGVLL